jgi:hypothetical protein
MEANRMAAELSVAWGISAITLDAFVQLSWGLRPAES